VLIQNLTGGNIEFEFPSLFVSMLRLQTAERLPVYRCAIFQTILCIFRRRGRSAVNRELYGVMQRMLQSAVMRAAEKQKGKHSCNFSRKNLLTPPR
jgi:hypothetical protein